VGSEDVYKRQIRNVIAVSDLALFTSRRVFDKLGGFNPQFQCSRIAAIDYCFRAIYNGYRNVYIPYEVRLNYIDKTGNAKIECDESIMLDNWKSLINDDPYYNRNLSKVGIGYDLS